jgi:hypothetical protein
MLVGFYLIYNNLRTGDRTYMKVATGEPCISVLVEVDTNNGLMTWRQKYISIRFSSLIKSPSICHNGNVPSRCSRPKWQTRFIPLYLFVQLLFSAYLGLNNSERSGLLYEAHITKIVEHTFAWIKDGKSPWKWHHWMPKRVGEKIGRMW